MSTLVFGLHCYWGLTWTADDLCRDDNFERDLYYTAFGTDEKKRGVDDFLAARRKKA